MSCGDKTEIVNVQPTTDQNDPPVIVALGPSWPSTTIDPTIRTIPSPYIIVADPDGLDDIALATFTVESAVITRIIVRPDSVLPSPYCTTVAWSDSVDITPMLPAAFTAPIDRCAMGRNGSMFTYSAFSWSPYGDPCDGFPAIAAASPYFGRPIRSCGPQYPLDRFGIYPPGVPAALDVNVTLAEVEYRGLSATVYDGVGHTATATFPRLRIVYRMYDEPTLATSAPAGSSRAAGTAHP